MLFTLHEKLLSWAISQLALLRASHFLGWHNFAAEALSRQCIGLGVWHLHPEVVSQIWKRFGKAQLVLFTDV